MDYEEYLRKQARTSKEIEDLKKMRAQAKASANNAINAASTRSSRDSRNSREHRSSRDVTSSSSTSGGGGGGHGARSRGTGTSLSKGAARRSGDRHGSPREDDNQRCLLYPALMSSLTFVLLFLPLPSSIPARSFVSGSNLTYTSLLAGLTCSI